MPEQQNTAKNKTLFISLVVAMALVMVMIYQVGVSDLFHAMLRIKWAILPIIAIHVLQVLFCSLAWRVLTPNKKDISYFKYFEARWIRESIASLLPIAQIGGEVIGARVLSLAGIPGVNAASSVIVDLTMEVITLFIFTLVGLGVFALDFPHNLFIQKLAIGLLFTLPVLIAFLAVQYLGLFRWITLLLERLAARWEQVKLADMSDLHDQVQSIYRRHGSLVLAFIYHLVAWVLGALEIWLILYCIGTPVSPGVALILESLTLAIRSAAFFLPGGIGAQEGGFIFIGSLLGLPPHISLAVSLIKRCREILLGFPGLLIWHKLELRNYSGKTASQSAN